MKEFESEPIPGLPGHLPPGETLLWQAKPDWRCLAKRAFHIPLIAGYLGLIVVWAVISAVYDGREPVAIIQSIAWMTLLIGTCAAILAVLAYATAHTTVYSITSERVVMRFGIALPMALNIPFAKIESAALRAWSDGSGDVPLTLVPGEKIAYVVLWPHARPWRMKRPEPMLRGLLNAGDAASILSRALAAYTSRPEARLKEVGEAALAASRPTPAPAAAAAAKTARPAAGMRSEAPLGAMSEQIARSA